MSKINIQFTLFSAFYTPLILVMSGGFLREQGLDYEWSVSAPGQSAVDAIVNGSADVVQTAVINGFDALKQGQVPPEVHFAQINEMDGFFITAREPDAEFSWSRLEGAEVVMFKSGQPNIMFQYACYKAGIDYHKIIPVTPGGAAEIDRAFRDGQGQYVQQQGPFPQQLEFDGIGHIVAQVGQKVGPCAFSSLAASAQWLETEEAQSFTTAYAKTRAFINSASANEVAESMASFFPSVDSSALQSCIATYQQLGCWTPHPEITNAAFEATLDIFEHTGTISERYRYEQVCVLPPGMP